MITLNWPPNIHHLMARRLKDKPKKPEPMPEPILSASAIFGGFKTEKPEPVREAAVEANQTLIQLHSVWKMHSYQSNYDIGAAIKKIPCSSADIEKFSLALIDHQGEKGFEIKAGLFLIAMMADCKENDVVIHTSHLTVFPDFIGEKNTRNIRVDGSAGSWVGRSMKSGTIIVKGDAGREAGGGMTGGTITIFGKAGEMSGAHMESGEMIINGDVGENIGQRMKGGSITINGNSMQGGIGFLMERGTIIVNGFAGRDTGRGMSGGSILVTGDVDITLGYGMKGGSIHLMGDASKHVGGVMVGGRLTVTGNTGDLLGERMKGGIITVGGNTGRDVGKGMEGGEIHINGDFISLGTGIKHGKIYHKEKLIIDE